MKKLILLLFIPLVSFGQSRDSLHQNGERAFNNKEYYKAIDYFTEAIKIKGTDYQSYAKRGRAKSNLNDYYGALEDYDKALEINPKSENIYVLRADAKKELGDFYGSIEDCDKFFEFESDEIGANFLAYSYRAESKTEIQDFYGAISDYTKTLSYDNHKITTYWMRGLVKKKLGDKDGACDDLQNAKDAYEKIKETLSEEEKKGYRFLYVLSEQADICYKYEALL